MHLQVTNRIVELFPEMGAFDERMRVILFDSQRHWFTEPIEYLLSLEGKRIRPILTLASARLFRDEPGPLALDIGLLIEILHSASLLHDDVIDESKVRRSRPTINFKWGDKVAILVGDYLLARLFYRIYEINDSFILQEFVVNSRRLSEGSLLELRQQYNPETTQEEYAAIVSRKTGSLFSLSCALGSYLAGASPTEVETMKTVGLRLGLAFQIIDDVLDYSGETEVIGKEAMKDLREGYFTLPFILSFADGAAKERAAELKGIGAAQWRERIGQELPYIQSQIRASYGIERARAVAEDHLDTAHALLGSLPDSEWRGRFESFMDRTVQRER
ncbi:MAG: polyprenyl synthetase family protein [bacterium]